MEKKPLIDVFISSTCRDLVDLRRELQTYLEAEDMVVRVSENFRSGFDIEPNADTIDVCLDNVRASRCVVLLIDRRYGDRLQGHQKYAALSATHAEFQVAKEENKKILLFIRRDAKADYDQPESPARWMDHSEKPDLVNFIKTASSVSGSSHAQRWIDTFETSVDLKLLVHERLAEQFPEYGVNRALLPDRIVRITFTYVRHVPEKTVLGYFTNVGVGPALNISHGFWAHNDWIRRPWFHGGLAEGQSIQNAGNPHYEYTRSNDDTSSWPNTICCQYENRWGDRYRTEFPLTRQFERADSEIVSVLSPTGKWEVVAQCAEWR